MKEGTHTRTGDNVMDETLVRCGEMSFQSPEHFSKPNLFSEMNMNL